DDILDVVGDTEKLGKPAGSDIENNKSTYVSLLGLEEAKKLVQTLSEEAIDSLKIFGEQRAFLKEFTLRLAKRDH
ncbi:MAG TPA: geranyl transferase, partial [Ruminococcaceae bacterium]|nr:geranyl transferase [Oscillospiraceae bacterium]